MKSKKINAIVSSLGSIVVIVIIGVASISYTILAKSDENIKVMPYTPPTIKGESGYQIDKYENIENKQWIDKNQVLILNKKGEFENPDSTISIMYCSIYNLNTNEKKEFKNVDIADFHGVSPDNKYVLYSEPRVIPKVGSDEWKKALDSGDLLHRKVKQLNLATGEITDVTTEKVNSDAEFKWVGNNKILANYNNHWAIIDASGKVYTNGSYNGGKNDCAWIAGTDNIKDLGDSLEGKFYYTIYVRGNNGGILNTKICTLDLKTKEVKDIFTNKNSSNASKKGNTIVMNYFRDNGEAVNKVFLNRTFGELILDVNGKVIHDIDLPKGIQNSNYVLSPDGSKAAYLEYPKTTEPIDKTTKSDENDEIVTLKVIDIKTGNVDEIVKDTSLRDDEELDYRTTYLLPDEYVKEKEVTSPIKNNISDIYWNNDGTELSFTYGNYFYSRSETDTYIVSFEK